MLRVPSVDPEQERRIAALEARLSHLREVPKHLWDANSISEKIDAVLEVLEHLRRAK